MHSVHKIVCGLMATGSIRTFYKSSFVEVKDWDNKLNRIKRPMLFTERIGLSAFGGLLFLTPVVVICMYNDAKRIESYVRNLDTTMYKTKIETEHDALF
jgi:hypothetical protein